MTGIIRIALAYFSALPLQRWTNVIGVAMMLIALAIRIASHGRATFEASATLIMFGGVLILLPIAIGGGMMRAASSRIILHLRPEGRQRMMLAATLVVTLLATAFTLLLVVALDPRGIEGVPSAPFNHSPPLKVFAISWSLIAVIWLAVFIATGNRLLSMLIGFVPLAVIQFGRAHSVALPDTWLIVAIALFMWASFSAWYLLATSIRRSIYSGTRLAEAYDNPLYRFFRWAAGADHSPTRARATDQYLLGMSPRGHVLLGVSMLVVAALLQMLMSRFVVAGKPDLATLQFLTPLFIAPVVIMSTAVIGFALTRRARILWLRAGLDRRELFRQIEQSGLRGGALSVGPFMVAILLYVLAKWPAHSDTIIVFLVVQIAFLICLFYGALSLTRGWSAPDVLVCIGMGLLLAGEVVLLRPWSGAQSAVAPGVLGAMVILAPLLRWHAQRRWLSLDWRVARIWQLPLRG